MVLPYMTATWPPPDNWWATGIQLVPLITSPRQGRMAYHLEIPSCWCCPACFWLASIVDHAAWGWGYGCQCVVFWEVTTTFGPRDPDGVKSLREVCSWRWFGDLSLSSFFLSLLLGCQERKWALPHSFPSNALFHHSAEVGERSSGRRFKPLKLWTK